MNRLLLSAHSCVIRLWRFWGGDLVLATALRTYIYSRNFLYTNSFFVVPCFVTFMIWSFFVARCVLCVKFTAFFVFGFGEIYPLCSKRMDQITLAASAWVSSATAGWSEGTVPDLWAALYKRLARICCGGCLCLSDASFYLAVFYIAWWAFLWSCSIYLRTVVRSWRSRCLKRIQAGRWGGPCFTRVDVASWEDVNSTFSGLRLVN